MMTIEQKAEAYEKVKEKIALRFGTKVAEEIFSEFEMSNDEKIKSVIRGWIYTRPDSFFDGGISKEEILTWIEKQAPREEPQVYKTEDGEIVTYSETDDYKVVETDLRGMVKAEPKSFEELKNQGYVDIP